MKTKSPLLSKLDIAAYVISVIVILLVILMRPAQRFHVDFDTSWMPGFHAIVNTIGSLFLIMALYFIKMKGSDNPANMI